MLVDQIKVTIQGQPISKTISDQGVTYSHPNRTMAILGAANVTNDFRPRVHILVDQ